MRFLHPGLYLFGQLPIQVQTVLGSCVALCAWHPSRRLLAVSHAMLPQSPAQTEGFDCRYADQVLRRLAHDMHNAGTLPQEYRYGLFGGACQVFIHDLVAHPAGEQNIAVFRAGLAGLRGVSGYLEDSGGSTYRRLVVDGRKGSFHLQMLEPLAQINSGAHP